MPEKKKKSMLTLRCSEWKEQTYPLLTFISPLLLASTSLYYQDRWNERMLKAEREQERNGWEAWLKSWIKKGGNEWAHEGETMSLQEE